VAIPTDEACSARQRIRPAVVRAYAHEMGRQVGDGGLRFPAVVLFTDGQQYWLADGFHRVLAARQAGLAEFPAEVRPGTLRDALLFAIAASAGHGVPRGPADKRKAVALVLADPEWAQWSDREIARRCRVSNSLVSRLRQRASVAGEQMQPRRVQRGDNVYTMRTRTRGDPRMAPEGPRTTADAGPPAGTLTDDGGWPVSSGAAPAFACLRMFAAVEQSLAQLAELVDQLAQAPGGAAFQQHLFRRVKDGRAGFHSPELQLFAQKLGSAAPHCGSCPRCHIRHAGRIQPACMLCGGRGWLSKREFELCPEPERQEFRRWHHQLREKSLAGRGPSSGPAKG
jgi:hypothetical protein